MAKEIERKFILKYFPEELKSKLFLNIEQGYLMLDEKKQLRVRYCHERASNGDYTSIARICYKYDDKDGRNEFEYRIPVDDAIELLNSTEIKLCKKRYVTEYKNCHVDIDLYSNGIQVVEIESNDGNFDIPDYCGEEITGNKNYSNIRIAKLGLSK